MEYTINMLPLDVLLTIGKFLSNDEKYIFGLAYGKYTDFDVKQPYRSLISADMLRRRNIFRKFMPYHTFRSVAGLEDFIISLSFAKDLPPVLENVCGIRIWPDSIAHGYMSNVTLSLLLILLRRFISPDNTQFSIALLNVDTGSTCNNKLLDIHFPGNIYVYKSEIRYIDIKCRSIIADNTMLEHSTIQCATRITINNPTAIIKCNFGADKFVYYGNFDKTKTYIPILNAKSAILIFVKSDAKQTINIEDIVRMNMINTPLQSQQFPPIKDIYIQGASVINLDVDSNDVPFAPDQIPTLHIDCAKLDKIIFKELNTRHYIDSYNLYYKLRFLNCIKAPKLYYKRRVDSNSNKYQIKALYPAISDISYVR
jgi:hypothetical protein